MAKLRETRVALAAEIAALPWVADDLDRGAEYNALRGLFVLADAGYLPALLEQPWLARGDNYATLEALWLLGRNKPERLDRIMSQPPFNDGIDDREAKIIAVISPGTTETTFEKLLDPDQVTLEERTITLPMSGETDIVILRTGPGTEHAMDSLQRAVEVVEEFMGLPFPQREVVNLFVHGPYGSGLNYGNHVKLWITEQDISRESLASLLAHQATRYYWRYAGGARLDQPGSSHIYGVYCAGHA